MKLYITAMSLFVLAVFYLPFVLWGLRRLWRNPRWQGMKKAGVLFIAILLAYAIPLGDVTIHSIAMAKVCPSAGLHIYKTVEVDGFIGSTALRDTPYRFNESPTLRPDGSYYWRRFEKQPDGSISVTDLEKPTAEYEVLTGGGYAEYSGLKLDSHYDQVTHASNSRWVIRNRATGEILSEWLFFRTLPGWLDRILVYRWFGYGGSALSCEANYDFSGWEEKVLRPKQSTN